MSPRTLAYYQAQVNDAPNQAERDYWLAKIEASS